MGANAEKEGDISGVSKLDDIFTGYVLFYSLIEWKEKAGEEQDWRGR